MWANNIFFQIDFFILLIVLIFCLRYILNKKHVYQVMKDFSVYDAILNIHMEKAYNIIHKEKVLIFSLEAQRIPEEHINVISKDFVGLVIKFLGPQLYKEYIFLFGNYETFVFTLLDYFNSNYENDEIRKDSMADIMNKNTIYPEGDK